MNLIDFHPPYFISLSPLSRHPILSFYLSICWYVLIVFFCIPPNVIQTTTTYSQIKIDKRFLYWLLILLNPLSPTHCFSTHTLSYLHSLSLPISNTFPHESNVSFPKYLFSMSLSPSPFPSLCVLQSVLTNNFNYRFFVEFLNCSNTLSNVIKRPWHFQSPLKIHNLNGVSKNINATERSRQSDH